MKLIDILNESAIVPDLLASTKTEALEVLVEAMANSHPEADEQEMKDK